MRKILIAVLVIVTTQAAWAQQYYEHVVGRINSGQTVQVRPDPGQESVIPLCRDNLRQWQSTSPQIRKIVMRSDKRKHVNVLVVSTAGDHLDLQFEDKRLVRAGFTLADHVRQMNVDEMSLRDAMKSWLAWYVSKDGNGRILQSYYATSTVASNSNLGINGPSGRPEHEVAPPKSQQNPSFEEQLGKLRKISCDLASVPTECRTNALAQLVAYDQRNTQSLWAIKVLGNGRYDLNYYQFRGNKLVQGQRKLRSVQRTKAEFGLWAQPEAAYPNLLLPSEVDRAKAYFEQVKRSPGFLGDYQGWIKYAENKIGMTIGSDGVEVLWLELVSSGHDGQETSVLGVAFRNNRIADWALVEYAGLRESDHAEQTNKFIGQFVARVCTIDPNHHPVTSIGGEGPIALADLANNGTRQILTRFFRLVLLNNEAEVLSYFRSYQEGKKWWQILKTISDLRLEQITLTGQRETTYMAFPTTQGRQTLKYTFDGKYLLVGN
ncbi:hypothetical protein KC644_02750 [Candidatus Berkelbacteria bacterium]|nr:hypothetical protein [Candidatus Berkelbacteria bacterium]